MGCDHYVINNTTISFGENEEIGCLCTFPHNYNLAQIDKKTVYKLALLGAAVKMVHEDFIDQDETKDYWYYINEVPQELRDRIAQLLGGVDFSSDD